MEEKLRLIIRSNSVVSVKSVIIRLVWRKVGGLRNIRKPLKVLLPWLYYRWLVPYVIRQGSPVY